MSIDVCVTGGGMIVHDQILPSLYHLQRSGAIGRIGVAATSSARLRDLLDERFERAFPGQSFRAHPPLDADPDERRPDLYKDAVAALAPRNLVVVATPDPLHYEMVRVALERDQHVLCVKPLVQTVEHAFDLEKLARERGLFVGVEYHKRFDRRALEAREHYRRGRFGQFRCGEAKMVEPYYYRHSNFQNWFTPENSDPFTYVGCHYVDQVYFITGLRPVEVSVRGVKGRFPNGNEAYMWSAGRVVFENGGILSVIDGLGYPDDGAGTNDQGITMFCDAGEEGGGPDRAAVIQHNDQFRGVSHGYMDKASGAYFRYVNPDYFRLVPWIGPGLKPVGYGYESIEASVVTAAAMPADPQAARAKLAEIDEQGLIATPGNSWVNELVTEAARKSIAEQGRAFAIRYEPRPFVEAA
jgi:predicted dehydrogenase